MESILAYRVKTYLNSISIKTKFYYSSLIDKWTIIVYLPNRSDEYYMWLSFKSFLLGDYSVFGNSECKMLYSYFDYLISDSVEELAMKLDLIGV
jgi:hypothetical protein